MRGQFVNQQFTNAYKATIGGDYLTKSVVVENTPVELRIWDTAGQERFNAISQAFYREADICVLVYDVTNYELVLSLREWHRQFLECCKVSRPGVILVGNKTDIEDDRCVDATELRDILLGDSLVDAIDDWDRDVLEVLSKNASQVESVFFRVAEIGLQQGRRSVSQDATKINIGHDQVSSVCAC